MQIFSRFSPDVRRAVKIDIGAAMLVALFTVLTGPFTGVILRRDLGATPFHLSILASANATCLLLSLAVTRVVDSRRPLASVVWTSFMARGLFLLVPFISSPWPFVGVLVTATLMERSRLRPRRRSCSRSIRATSEDARLA